jgi:ATP-dependent RNA helicase DeaD
VAFCTLDEADEMMALGFAEDMEAILAQLPNQRQVACFSATMPARIVTMTQKFLRDPVHVSIEAKQRTLETTNQTYYEVPRGKKLGHSLGSWTWKAQARRLFSVARGRKRAT